MSTDRFADIAGRRVRIRVSGDGPPVLLINGLGANVDTWTGLLHQLDGFRLIRFDAPGTGRSQTPRMPYSVATIADIARRVLDEVGVERADVLGYSLGGAVTQRLAYQEPNRVRRLVLVSSSVGAGAVPGALRSLLAVMTPARHHSAVAHRVTMKVVELAPAEKASPVISGQIHSWHQQATPSALGYALQMTAFSTFHSLPWLHTVHQPTLVLSGSDDRLIPMANSAVLAAHLRNSRLRIFEGWGHYLLHDAASGAGATVADFLGSVDHTVSAAWEHARTVSAADMTAFVKEAPKSAHPSSLTSGLVRRLHPPRSRD